MWNYPPRRARVENAGRASRERQVNQRKVTAVTKELKVVLVGCGGVSRAWLKPETLSIRNRPARNADYFLTRGYLAFSQYMYRYHRLHVARREHDPARARVQDHAPPGRRRDDRYPMRYR